MTKHTPGPWAAREPNGPGNGWRVGPAWLGEKPWSDETSANAHLIAAAPDLMAACEAFVKADYSTWLLKYVDAIDAAKAAIAKARGEKP
jgi:hypothetical protein